MRFELDVVEIGDDEAVLTLVLVILVEVEEAVWFVDVVALGDSDMTPWC